MTSPLQYGRVEDWIGGLIEDGDDAEYLPDDVDLTGTAKFEPILTDTNGGIRVPGMSPRPKWLTVQPVEGTYVNGRLTFRGQNFVMLLAPNAEVNPTNWKWKVTFSLRLNGNPIVRSPFAFALPPYDPNAAPLNPGGPNPTIVNLVTVQPVAVPGSGTGVVQGPRGFGVLDARAAGSDLILSVASESGPVDLPPVPLPAGGSGGGSGYDGGQI